MIFMTHLMSGQFKAQIDPDQYVIKIDNNQSRSIRSNTLDIATIQKRPESLKVVPLHTEKKKGGKPSILDGIYVIHISTNQSVYQIIDELKNYDNVIYAEPVYLDYPLLTTDDPNSDQQNYLDLIEAFQAWDYTIADSTLTIGIIDTGVDFDHEDLQNVQYNFADPINGIDDDGNGYVDDFSGWDFANSDNDPTADQSGHGTQVTGVASASTNNNIGIAGIGYNARFLPLKIFESTDGSANNAYEAIIYAADNGCDVINLSWGGVGSFSQYRQDIIDYAVIEKDVIIVAAAGNTNENLNFYPASYEHVLSVSATQSNDQKASFATYGPFVDLVAPGDGIYTTSNGSNYTSNSGTSLSSPMVAGAAILLRDLHPDWTAGQIMEQLRVSTNEIYSIGNNMNYQDFLGSGRLNIRSAILFSGKSIRAENVSYSNGIGEIAYFGDTLRFSMDLINYLSQVDSLFLDFSSDSPYVTIEENESYIGTLDSLQVISMESPTLRLSEDTPSDEQILIKLTFSGVDYNDYQFFEFYTEPDITDFGFDTQLSIASDGSLGYYEDDTLTGIGFISNGNSLLTNIGIIAAKNPDSLSNNTNLNFFRPEKDNNFQIEQKSKYYNHPIADLFFEGSFTDDMNSTPLGLIIEQQAFGWNNGENNDNIILSYRISNKSNETIDSLFYGIFADWNIAEGGNATGYNLDENFSFSVNEDSTHFTGIGIISPHQMIHNHIDLSNLSDSTFNDSLKFELVSQFDSTQIINTNSAQTTSTLVADLEAGASEKIAFVLTASTTYTGLVNNVEAAQTLFNEIEENPRVIEYINVCPDQATVVIPSDSGTYEFYSDAIGANLIQTDTSIEVTPSSDTTLYFRKVDGNVTSELYALGINVIPTSATFTMDKDTLYLGDVPGNLVTFADTSPDVVSRQWDFDNGNYTQLQNPVISYNEEGEFQVTLAIETSYSCQTSTQQALFVANRGDSPEVTDQIVCEGSQASINASNSDSIRVYADSLKTTLLFEGSSFTTGTLFSDTLFFVTNIEPTFESTVERVDITIDPIEAIFNYQADSTLLENESILLFNESENANSISWIYNGETIGTDNIQVFELPANNQFDLELVALSENNCSNSRARTISKSISPSPTTSLTLICTGEDAIIQPGNGQIFFFYSDESLTNLIYKGSQLLVSEITGDTAIFITGFDSLIQSDPVEALINVDEFEVQIVTESDTLFNEGPQLVSLSTNNSAAESFAWYLEGSLFEVVAAPTIFLEGVGVYEIVLVSENSQGCVSTDTTSISIIERPVPTAVDEMMNLSIYPNPSNGTFQITDGYTLLDILDISGKEVEFRKTKNRIQLSGQLGSGVFYLKISNGNNLFFKKLIKN